MRAILIGSGGPVLGREYILEAPIVTIGRRDENTVVIKDPTVSRKHAEIRREGDDFLIADKNSTSGVMVNGQAIAGEQRLRDGDRISIGTSAIFLVQLQPVEEKTITFSQAELGDQNRTQFITRTDLDDPRAIPSEPAPVAPPPAPARPFETPPGGTPEWHSAPPPAPAPAAPPLFTPAPAAPPPQVHHATPAQQQSGDFAPPPAPDSSATRGWSVPQQEPPAPNFAPPQFAPPPANQSPPTFSAAPEVPRFGGNTPPPPSFIPPPASTSGGDFGAPAGGQAFGSPPPAPSFAPPSAPGGASRGIGVPSSASASPSSSRRGLIIGLVVLLLLVIIAIAVAVLLLSGGLSGS